MEEGLNKDYNIMVVMEAMFWVYLSLYCFSIFDLQLLAIAFLQREFN